MALRVCFRLLEVLLLYKTLFLLFCSSSYIIEQGVCYLVLCEATFPKKLAFAYLEDLHSEFDEQYGKKVPTVSRPYCFIEFGKYCSLSLGLGSKEYGKSYLLCCYNFHIIVLMCTYWSFGFCLSRSTSFYSFE